MTLLQQLVKKGFLDKEKATPLEFEIKSSGRKEEEILLEKAVVSEPLLFGLKSEALKIPLKEVTVDEISLKILELIPAETARFYQMLPLSLKDGVLEVGMVYPEDLMAQEALKFLSRQGNFSYKVFLMTISDYKNLLKKYHSLKREVKVALEQLETEMQQDQVGKRPSTPDDFERLVEEAPVSKVVAVCLRHAVEGGASDIHIEPSKEKVRIRFRLLGSLHSSIFLPMRVHPAVVARVKILSDLRIDETRLPQDGRFTAKINERDIDFRVSTFPTTLGEKVVIRVLDPATGLRSFDKLGLEGRNLDVAKNAIKRPFGLLLASGPTGCGKSTTLYAILRLLNKEGVNIVTLEDPVEYFIEGVSQSQVKPEIGYTFAVGLRHIMRQDPDIIMVGEIRDEETAFLAIHAALTGHIVLSTLHTNNVMGVIPRLIDLGIKPYLIAPTLACAIGQRLVRKLCVYCREKVKPSKEIQELIAKELAALPPAIQKEFKIPSPLYVYQAKGCKQCGDLGFSGQIGIFETLAMNERLSNIILRGADSIALAKEAVEQGMATMRQDGILKALEGETTIEEVLAATDEQR
ncbi:MAG: ATPase, T2SS/T4P/T4SS family [Patescibacteria group bacterium]